MRKTKLKINRNYKHITQFAIELRIQYVFTHPRIVSPIERYIERRKNFF